MLRPVSVFLASALLLAGCDTRQLNELDYAEQQEVLKKFAANCAAAGVTEKSPQYRTCIQTEINAENSRRSRQTAGMASLGQGFTNMGNSYTAAAQVRPQTCRTIQTPYYGARMVCS